VVAHGVMAGGVRSGVSRYEVDVAVVLVGGVRAVAGNWWTRTWLNYRFANSPSNL